VVPGSAWPVQQQQQQQHEEQQQQQHNQHQQQQPPGEPNGQPQQAGDGSGVGEVPAASDPLLRARGLEAWEAVAADGWGLFAGGLGHEQYFPALRVMGVDNQDVS
jgi:hypothetical protein